MLLYGNPVVAKLQTEVIHRVSEHRHNGKYVAFFLLSHEEPSRVYVGMKCAFAEKVGLQWQVLGRADWALEETLEMIKKCNRDDNCLGIVIQLPLAEHLQPHKATILSAVSPTKDVDGLGGVLVGLAWMGKIDFVPATPKAVLEMLDFYHIDHGVGHTISILWQSDLVGKPLAIELMKRGATVLTFNASSDPHLMRSSCQASQLIVSATWVMNLVDESFVRHDHSQYIIDVGRWISQGRARWDTDWEALELLVAGITPVPGWVGPVTVACLFHNLLALDRLQKEEI